MSKEDFAPMEIIIKTTGETFHGKFPSIEAARRTFTAALGFPGPQEKDIEVHLLEEKEENALLP